MKNGISLIVLVITIIIMIILAGATIITLRGTDVINKAKYATKQSDLANAKEIVENAYAKWILMSEYAQEEENSFVDFATKKLEESGFDMSKYDISETGDVMLADIKEIDNVNEYVFVLNDDNTCTFYTSAGYAKSKQ